MIQRRFELTLEEIDAVSEWFLEQFLDGVVLLRGDLAAGKTTLVKSFAKVMGVEDCVTSPTFSLQQVYCKRLYHYDLYAKGLEHFLSLGLLEELAKEGLHCVEWGDKYLEDLLRDAGIAVATIDINKIDFQKREYIVCIH